MPTKTELGLLLVYGERLPAAGVAFMAPVFRGKLRKVDKALRICAERWPIQVRGKKYDGLWATGEMSHCDERKDMKMMRNIRAWRGIRYKWDFEKEKFISL